jgi:methylenetetrahydrofolate dehydrogenase (NADP+)/methenyltetrahydrofolate cyclohydrolase
VSARILDGAAIAAAIREEIAGEVRALAATGTIPGLAVVIVGDDPASQLYVKSKGQACHEAGMLSETVRLPAETTEAELLAVVDRLNADPAIHGFLVQLPLPRHIDAEQVLNRIAPAKDVDGFHPVNVGRLSVGDPAAFRPATPYGVQQMLIRSGIETKGAHAVILGRSNIVGKPMASLFLQDAPGGNATVTVCHSRSRPLERYTSEAEIVVAAVGRPGLLTGEHVRSGAVVVDVGTNVLDDGALVGDVEPASTTEVAAALTPVPGGVGTVTTALLVLHTTQAALRLSDALSATRTPAAGAVL